MTTPDEAAALTEQIAEVLAEHRWERGTEHWGCPCGERCPDPLKGSAHRAKWMRTHQASEVAARLADSRPVVSEAAIEAAVKAMVQESNQFKPASYDRMARAALTAALPHIGDGKGEA